MHRYWILLLCTGLSMMVFSTQGYSHHETMDTSRGFCVARGFGRIPIGTTRYTDGTCEKLTCSQGRLTRESCDMVIETPGCQVVVGLGRQYPGCCPQLICG